MVSTVTEARVVSSREVRGYEAIDSVGLQTLGWEPCLSLSNNPSRRSY